MREKKLRYIAYLRKSTEDEERQVLSKGAQRESIEKLFSDKLNIVGYLDESKSAFEPGKREVFQKILDMFDKGEVDGLIAWHPDRLSRNSLEAAAITHRIGKGIIKDMKFASFTFDNSPEGIMMLQMVMSQSQYFSAKLSKDVKRGIGRKAQMGGISGRAPEGYLNDVATKSVIPDPIRFPIIRKAFNLYLTGDFGVGEVLDAINNSWHYKTVKRKNYGGGSLSRASFYNLLRNPRYAGQVPDPFDESVLYEGDYEHMITKEEYDQVQRLLGNKRAPRLSPGKQFPLKGLLIRCGECDCMVTAETKTKKLKNGDYNQYTYYHCTGKRTCKQKGSVREEDLSQQAEDLLDQYELSPKLYEWGMDALQQLAKKEIAERKDIQAMQHDTIESVQQQIDTLLDLATKGFITAEEFDTKSKSLKSELEESQNEQSATAYRVRNWYEIAGNLLQTLTNANTKFAEGDCNEKRDILLAIGYNPVLMDKRLLLTPNEWLIPIKNELPSIREQLNKVITKPQQIQKASEEAVRIGWYL